MTDRPDLTAFDAAAPGVIAGLRHCDLDGLAWQPFIAALLDKIADEDRFWSGFRPEMIATDGDRVTLNLTTLAERVSGLAEQVAELGNEVRHEAASLAEL